METLDELKQWVNALSTAEKRFVKVIGKARAGASPSQQLKLFDWLNRAHEGEYNTANAEIKKNLPTVSVRLKDLILDSLRLLHKEDTTEAILRTTLDEIAVLYDKKLYRAVEKQVRRAKKLATSCSRYSYAFQCIEWEKKLAPNAGRNTRELLEELRAEEIAMLKKISNLCDLQHRHDSVLAIMRQSLFRRAPERASEINALADAQVICMLSTDGGYLERALAVNISGLRDLNERKASDALFRYQELLKEWQTKPDWQREQSHLLLLICKLYQTACFFSQVDWEEARKYIEMASNFKGLSPDAKRDFQRLLYHNEFTLSLNSGKLEVVHQLIPEIDRWLDLEREHLNEVQLLPFLCNFAVAQFLSEHYAEANRTVVRILNLPNRDARKDIRGFALLLQAVLQFELKNNELQEALTRAGKRYFKKDSLEINFELMVLRHLERAARLVKPKEIQLSFKQLVKELDDFAESTKGLIPILGLNEIRMWARAKQDDIALPIIFLEVLKEVQQEAESSSAVD